MLLFLILLFFEINFRNGRPKYLPTIVTGDFNLQPETAVYRFLREGFLRYADLTARSLTYHSYGQPHQEFLLPYELQISNHCQHLGLMLHRLKQTNNRSLDSVDVSTVTKVSHCHLFSSFKLTNRQIFWSLKKQYIFVVRSCTTVNYTRHLIIILENSPKSLYCMKKISMEGWYSPYFYWTVTLWGKDILFFFS